MQFRYFLTKSSRYLRLTKFAKKFETNQTTPKFTYLFDSSETLLVLFKFLFNTNRHKPVKLAGNAFQKLRKF